MKKIIMILAVVVGGAIWIWGTFSSQKDVVEKVEDPMEKTGEVAMESNEEIMEQGKEEIVEEVVLESADSRGGIATATRVSTDEFRHTVTADVADPNEGKFYEGWLVKKNLGVVTGFYSTGAMEKNEEGKYVLVYTAPIDEKAEYNEVVITEETTADGLDGKPELHIFEGAF